MPRVHPYLFMAPGAGLGLGLLLHQLSPFSKASGRCRARSRERQHSRDLRADARSAVDHTLSLDVPSVILHGCHPQSGRSAFHVEALAVVPNGEA